VESWGAWKNVPAGYGRCGSTGRVRAGSGQSYALEICGLCECRAELHNGNIAIVGVRIVVGVDHDRLDLSAFTRCAVLRAKLAVGYILRSRQHTIVPARMVRLLASWLTAQ